MPGLQQLNKFTEKLLSLGGEPKIRSESGEPRLKIPLPAAVSETDDSDDFMFGLAHVGAPPPEEVSDDDFLSDLIPPDEENSDASDDDDFFSKLPSVPDREPLSLQEDIPEESAVTPDDLDADLNGEEEAAADLDALFSGLQLPDTISELPDDISESASDAEIPELSSETDFTPDEVKEPVSDLLPEIEESDLQSTEDEFGTNTDFNLLDDLNLSDSLNVADEKLSQSDEKTEEPPAFAAPDFDMPADFDLLKDLDLPDGMNLSDSPSPEPIKTPSVSETEDSVAPDSDLSALLGNIEDLFDGNLPDPEPPVADLLPTETDDGLSDNDVTETDFGSFADLPNSLPDDMPDFSSLDDTNLPDPDSQDDNNAFPSFDMPDSDFPALDSLPAIDDLQPKTSGTTDDFSSFGDFDTDASSVDSLSADDLPDVDFTANDSMPGEDFSVPDADIDFTNDEPVADDPFADLVGADFDLPPLAAPTGSEQNVSLESGDFEFDANFFPSDENKASPEKTPKIPEPAAPLPNEFTENEYKQFLNNLYLYPLNLRVAIEELIVENQFTDETVSDLIRRVIKKTGARPLASYMSKLLDKSIQVPRDFEKRTSSQYDLYKQSVEYQIKNRVLPAVFLTFAAVALGALFLFLGTKFLYRPIRAEILYNQGYTLLKDNAYPQAEQKFNEAVTYSAVKSWFLKYAAAYREHKQYERARKVYESGLLVFNNDKKIGLEYATMELKDLANYERAEEIIKRKILDFHINDKDGILLLGDVYLDWATEKDPAKFEEARKQYASLIEMYGETDLYLSRMMRYFIRTDNLREVLPLKDYFLPKKKALSGPDLVELSGYLLEKQYGPLSPADEYLRAYIEDVRTLLERALQADQASPEAHYNFGKYLIYIGNREGAKSQLSSALASFTALSSPRTRALISKNIDTYRLLGDLYSAEKEYLMAEELYALGIQMYEKERGISALVPDVLYGKMYAGMGDLNYFISGDLDSAYTDYQKAIEQQYDTPSIRYKVGYIQYSRKKYPEALGSFIKTAGEKPADRNLLYALANVLSVRGDNYAAQAYYEMLMTELDIERTRQGVLFPQVNPEQGDLVTLYMYASNNLGVTLFRLAQQTGDSGKNARAMVCFSDAARAWDALTRNQITMTRLDGSNLAAQNLKYAAFPMPNYQPEIFTDIFRTLYGEPFLVQPSLKK